jgi:hypothetical protein
MADDILEPIAALAVRHEKVLSGIAVAWFVLTWAAAARFIALPDVPYLTDHSAWMISGPWNAIWWGFLRPQIIQRKAELQEQGEESAAEPPDDSNR